MKIIYNDGHVDECPADDELHVIRHTAAHILAQAVKHLYPQAHFAYGPATEKGFHYDVDLGDVKLSDEDLKTIEKEMQAIVKQNLPIKPFALGREDAIKLMQERGEIYKVEHIGDLPEDATLTFYQQGDYIDMVVGSVLSNLLWGGLLAIILYPTIVAIARHRKPVITEAEYFDHMEHDEPETPPPVQDMIEEED